MKTNVNNTLPTVGIIVFEKFLTNEVLAPIDVFAKPNQEGKKLFNVVLLAKENKPYTSDDGLKVIPDYTFDNSPDLDVLIVPSSYHPEVQQRDKVLVDFISEKHKSTTYTASHCAGAFLLAEAGIATNKEIVTYVTGGEILQEQYPSVKVLDDNKIAVAKDGKIFSSNGSLVSYLASLDLLEKLTTSAHRSFVEDQLLLKRLTAESSKLKN